MSRTHTTFIRIGQVRIDTDIVTAYLPLWTEGHITGIALYIEGRAEAIRAAVENDEALVIIERLDNLKLR
jgi:hypothetical protein